MATYWLSATTGDDVDDGLSYADAFATIGYAISQATTKGDIINVVNDGDHDFFDATTNRTAPVGTSWEDFGLMIRGTDSDGNLALATFVAVDGVVNEIARIISGPAYWIVKGLKFDYSAETDGGFVLRQQSHTSGPVWVTQCIVEGGNTITTSGSVKILEQTGTPSGDYKLRGPTIDHCYFHNTGYAITIALKHNLSCTSNVFVNSVTGSHDTRCLYGSLGLGEDCTQTFSGNTIYLYKDYATASSGALYHKGEASADLQYNLANNLIYVDCGTSGNKGSLGGLFDGFAIFTQTVLGDSGYNYFNIGTRCTASGSWTNGGIYQNPWATLASGTATDDVIVTDTLSTNVTALSVFGNITNTYSWVLDEYTLPILDFRAIIGTNASSSGGQVGALPAFNNAPVAVADNYGPVIIGQTLNVTSGSGVLVNDTDADDDPLTASLTTAVDYGALNLSSDGSFVYTADASYLGTATFEYRAHDGIEYSNVTTVTIDTTSPDEVAPVVPDLSYSVTNTIDVAPIFMPTREVTARAAIMLNVNRKRDTDVRAYVDQRRWSEVTSRSVDIDTNTSTELTMGGIASASDILLTADGSIEVAVNSATNYWAVSEVLALQSVDVSHIYVRNLSTSTEVAVDVILVN